MSRRCHWCRGERRPARVATGNAELLPPYRGKFSTLDEQMQTFRLIELVTQRPDLAGLASVGSRLAAAVGEGA